MKRLAGFVRFILLSAGFIFAVLLALTAIYGDNVAGLVIQEINSRSEVKTTLNDARLSLLRRFPRASVILSDVAVRGPVEVTGNDTIVRASSITLEFKISNILRKNYTVEWLSISGGAVNIFTDSSGISNIPQARKKEGREAPANLNIDLRNIRVDNILLSTLNKPKNHSSSVLLKSARLSGKMASNDIVLRADGAFEINTLSVNGINVRDTVGGRISLDFH
ncbi:MAG: hypothetical protein FJY11_07715, partial [Bacteroidetes bacterium]|nr:hypothetical protein [Bacteroidota bacterium]